MRETRCYLPLNLRTQPRGPRDAYLRWGNIARSSESVGMSSAERSNIRRYRRGFPRGGRDYSRARIFSRFVTRRSRRVKKAVSVYLSIKRDRVFLRGRERAGEFFGAKASQEFIGVVFESARLQVDFAMKQHSRSRSYLGLGRSMRIASTRFLNEYLKIQRYSRERGGGGSPGPTFATRHRVAFLCYCATITRGWWRETRAFFKQPGQSATGDSELTISYKSSVRGNVQPPQLTIVIIPPRRRPSDRGNQLEIIGDRDRCDLGVTSSVGDCCSCRTPRGTTRGNKRKCNCKCRIMTQRREF